MNGCDERVQSLILSLSRPTDKRPIIFGRIDAWNRSCGGTDSDTVAKRQYAELFESFDGL